MLKLERAESRESENYFNVTCGLQDVPELHEAIQNAVKQDVLVVCVSWK